MPGLAPGILRLRSRRKAACLQKQMAGTSPAMKNPEWIVARV